MNPEDGAFVRAQLAGFKDQYPDLKIEGRGLFRVWIGYGDFNKLSWPGGFHWNELTEFDIRMPVICDDLLTAFMATRVFRFDGNGSGVKIPRSMSELEEMRFLPDGFLALKQACLLELSLLLRRCGLPLSNSVVQRRAYCYRLMLSAGTWTGDDVIAAAERSVLNRWKTELVHGKPRRQLEFAANWRDPLIDSRGKSALQLISRKRERLQKDFERFETRKKRDAQKASKAPKSEGPKRKRKPRRPLDAGFLISAYPAPHELSRHQTTEIIRGAVRGRENPVCLVLALAISTLSQPASMLRDSFVEPTEVNGVFLNRRKNRRLHLGPKDSSDVYEESSDELPIFWPPAPTRTFLDLKRSGELRVKSEDVDAMLRRLCPQATWRKLVHTLVRHGTPWFGLPWMWLLAAAYPGQKKPAPSHYSRLGPNQYRMLLPFLSLFDPAMLLPDELPATLAFGSRWVPKLDHLRQFARRWRHLLEQPLPGDFWGALFSWNVLVGGAYDISRLMGGLRAGAIPPPTRIQVGVPRPITILKQKRVVLAYSPAPVQEFWPLLLQRRAELHSRAAGMGLSVDPGESGDTIYSHYRIARLGGRQILRSVVPDHHNTAEAYQSHPDFQEFCTWWPAWPRHFSNTYLRERGYPELAVQRFHRHAPSGLEPLLWNQGFSAIDFDFYDKVSKDFSHLLLHS